VSDEFQCIVRVAYVVSCPDEMSQNERNSQFLAIKLPKGPSVNRFIEL